jgi:nitrous oxidase accessory protein NosD
VVGVFLSYFFYYILLCAGTLSTVITDNAITACLGNGVSVAENSIVRINTIVGVKGYIAISIYGSNNTVVGNTISDELYNGIGVSSGGNLIRDNNIAADGAPVSLAGGGNLIYPDNFFISSDKFGSPGGSTWDSNGEGNQWGTYTGKDLDLDGIGDTPYANGDIVDSYPFIKPKAG